jgi:hypothetical protein
VAELLRRLGYLERGHLVAVTRDDPAGQYVGHRPQDQGGPQTSHGRSAVHRRCYYLHRADNERDYGQESIEILLQIMEN